MLLYGIRNPDRSNRMSNPNEVPVKPGDVLDGKYRVERVLGSGGMGVVVQARHIDLNTRIAIKFMLPEALQDPESVARFQREARAAVRLRSEHTARVLDVGRLRNGAPYMVMEFLVGKDLGQIVEESGALPAGAAVEYILQACEALAEAHALGIVHRDVKPRNLFLSQRIDGRPLVKVLDFGLAKTVERTDQHALTRTTAVMGSPQYMSPEQMRASREVDGRTDVWSLGVCLYELLTGTVPFDAPTVPMLCALVLKEAPRAPHELRAHIPVPVSAAIMRCLEKDPAHRFANVAELADALEPFGSAAAHGSANRVRHVLTTTSANLAESEALPPAEAPMATIIERSGDTRTAASFDSRPKKDPARSLLLVLAGTGVVLVVAAAVVVMAIFLRRSRVTATAVAGPPPSADVAPVTADLPAPTPVPPPPLASAQPVPTVPVPAPPPRITPGSGTRKPSGLPSPKPPPPVPPSIALPALPGTTPPAPTPPKKDPGANF